MGNHLGARRHARQLLRRLRVDALADAVVKLSQLIADHADRIGEIEVNPLFVGHDGVVAADCLITVKG